jgi:hypothetical protein
MHLNFAFTAIQILWTVRFAALLVLLVVLLGRDRISRFPWFTGSIVLATLSHLTARLLYGRLPQLTFAGVSIVLLDLSAIVAVLVLVEIARRVFARAAVRAWAAGAGLLIAAGVLVLLKWGPWPAAASLKFDTPIAALGLLQLIAEKLGLFNGVLTIGLGLLVAIFGSRFGSGIRSHAQQIILGLSAIALSQISVQIIWQVITRRTTLHSMEEYQHMLAFKERLINTNDAIYAAVLVVWIICLWFDEPGSKQAVEPETSAPAALELPTTPEA